MQRNNQDILLEVLGATAEVMGNQLQPAALMLMAEDLSEYPLDAVLNAVKRCRRELSGRLNLAAIIERVQSTDGTFGAEEAWAVMSRPEGETVVITDQMGEAMQFARHLLDDKDHVAARMAFKEAYTRIMNKARDEKIKPHWFISFGHDEWGRVRPVAEAIRVGKLQLDNALKLMSPENANDLLKLTGNENHPLYLENKQDEPRDIAEGLSKLGDLKRSLTQKLTATP